MYVFIVRNNLTNEKNRFKNKNYAQNRYTLANLLYINLKYNINYAKTLGNSLIQSLGYPKEEIEISENENAEDIKDNRYLIWSH